MTPAPSQRVADLIIARLARDGIRRVFGVPGGACSGLDHALHRHPLIEHVICQHEAMAGYMAMGYHLATGLPGVVTVTSGPGVLNALPAAASARLDEISLLVLAGEVATTSAHRGALQDGGWTGLDTIHVMRSLGGLALNIDHADQALSRLEQALSQCYSHVRGPAFLQIPINVQNARALETSISYPVSRSPEANPESLDAASRIIASAARPCIFAGIGVKRSGTSHALRRLAEHLDCPVISDAEAVGVLPRTDPHYYGCYGVGDTGATRSWLEQFDPDLLIFVGARLDDTSTNGYADQLTRTRSIHLDYSKTRVGRSIQTEMGIVGDLESTLTDLQRRLPGRIAVAHKTHEAFEPIDEPRQSHGPGKTPAPPFNPTAIIRHINRTFGASTTFVSDIGNHLLAVLGHINIQSVHQLHFSLGLGGMGSGIGMSMGMAAAMLHEESAEHSRVIGICGDGGLAMSGNEVLTCSKYSIPAIILVFNDQQLGMVAHGIKSIYGSSDPYATDKFDVVGWASALGASSFRLESMDQFERVRAWRGPGPLVVDIPIDPAFTYQNPREDVVAFPSRGQ